MMYIEQRNVLFIKITCFHLKKISSFDVTGFQNSLNSESVSYDVLNSDSISEHVKQNL